MATSRSGSFATKAILLFVSTLTVTAGATIAPALPAMKAHFAGVPNIDFLVALAISLPPLFIVLGSPPAGMIVDRWGRKGLLLLSLVLYVVTGVSGYWLESLAGILISRALLGLAVAGLTTCVTTLIADYYTGPERAQMMGFQAGFMALDGVIFTLLGGFLADISWRLPFLLHLLAAVALLLVAIWISEPERQAQKADQASGQRERLPVGTLWVIYFITFSAQIAFYLVPVNIPFLLQDMSGAKPSMSGMTIAVTTLFMFIGALLYKRITLGIDFLGIVVRSMVLMAVGYAVVGAAQSFPVVLVGLVIGGFGLGLLLPNNKVWVSTVTPGALRGRGLGLLMSSMYLGQFLSPVVSQPVKAAWGLSAAFLAAGIFLLVLAAVFLVVKRRAIPAAAASLGES